MNKCEMIPIIICNTNIGGIKRGLLELAFEKHNTTDIEKVMFYHIDRILQRKFGKSIVRKGKKVKLQMLTDLAQQEDYQIDLYISTDMLVDLKLIEDEYRCLRCFMTDDDGMCFLTDCEYYLEYLGVEDADAGKVIPIAIGYEQRGAI